MKNLAKKASLLLMMILLLFTMLPTKIAFAADTYEYTFSPYIIWHGGDPTDIDFTVLAKTPDWYSWNPFGVYNYTCGVTVTASNAIYIGNGEWKSWVDATMPYVFELDHLPFFEISRGSVDGKWYVDKWAWNNAVYKPGAYVPAPYNGEFFLTSSAPTNNTLTINRSFAAGSAAVETTFDIFRYYSHNDQQKDYFLIKSVTLTAGESSTQVSGLYGGTYAVLQRLPGRYIDDANFSFSKGTGRDFILSSGTNATASFTDSYSPPTLYNISVTPVTGGTIAANLSQAAAGETVSLTVTPNTDMQMVGGSLKYNVGTDYAISGTSFVMPASPVTVSAQFERKKYSAAIGALTGGTITASPSSLISGETVELTIAPDAGKLLKAGSLTYTYESTVVPISGTSFALPQANVTISAVFEDPLAVATGSLPVGMAGVPYSATLAGTGGTSPYAWSAINLPGGLSLNPLTGAIGGTPTKGGMFDVEFTLTDDNGGEAKKTIVLKINNTCGNGGYLITPIADSAYTASMTDAGLPTMTVNAGVTGFKLFSVAILKEKGHAGIEALLFVHKRNGQQIGLNASFADYDSTDKAKSGFNVKPGDVIEVYVVDDLSNDEGTNPQIL